MPIFQMQIDTAHPVLFLSDSGPNWSIPEDSSQRFAMTTADCLSFWVLSFVDGASLVTITDQDCAAGAAKLFSGSIDAPSGVLTLSDSHAFHYINVPVPPGRVFIDLWADDSENPGWVWVKLGAIRAI